MIQTSTTHDAAYQRLGQSASLPDEQFAEVIVEFAESTHQLGWSFHLGSILEVLPKGYPISLDAAISCALSDLRRSGESQVAAVATLLANYPEHASAIHVCALLDDFLPPGAIETADRPVFSLPARFGPLDTDGQPKFELTAILGRGVSGTVYAAIDRTLDPDGQEPHVAIKIFDGQFTGSSSREALASRIVRHPNVVRVFEVGVGESDGTEIQYAAYELANSGTLDDAFDDTKQLSPSDALSIVIQVARGLDALHRRGRLHGDLKPANILIFEEDGADEPAVAKIADLGGVLMDSADRLDATLVSASRGLPCGNVALMAPEVRDGEMPTVGSDVFSIGKLLAYLLSGEVADANTGLQGINDRLRLIIERATAENPTARHRSALELAEDLDAWRAGRSIDWLDRNPVRVLGVFANPRPLIASSIVALVLALGASVWGLLAVREQRLNDAELQMRAELATAVYQDQETWIDSRESIQNSVGGMMLLDWLLGRNRIQHGLDDLTSPEIYAASLKTSLTEVEPGSLEETLLHYAIAQQLLFSAKPTPEVATHLEMAEQGLAAANLRSDPLSDRLEILKVVSEVKDFVLRNTGVDDANWLDQSENLDDLLRVLRSAAETETGDIGEARQGDPIVRLAFRGASGLTRPGRLNRPEDRAWIARQQRLSRDLIAPDE